MKIREITIINFRKLKQIHFDCSNSVNTIVGPNGVGKSTIIDAIRIVKAILLQTSENEAQATLQNMGIFAPQTGGVLLETICGDIQKETSVELLIEISKAEIQRVKQEIQSFAIQRLQIQLGQNGISKLQLIPFLSTPLGKQRQIDVVEETEKLLVEFEKTNIAEIKLSVKENQVLGDNGFHQELVAYLLISPIFSETLFTIFPADRSFPTGDPNIQLGQAESGNQLQSYSIQPQIKFSRLKAAIISYLMISSNDMDAIKNDFTLIFDNLLPGKELDRINIDPRTGRLSVLIKETQSGSIYDIDFLSSGEKGLLLTFFLLLRTIRKDAIILLDEPELHLNPAVCQRIIPFLKKYICEGKNAQIILTTHSAEILADTKEDESARLWHLINDVTISQILKKDNEEAQEAIKCLGVSTSDLLFNKGVIYLEGVIDEDYLYEILRGRVDGFKIQSLGGRISIENEVKLLQEFDEKGKLRGYHVFILDFDNKPTPLKDTANVKIVQWDGYSLENYFLDVIILYDVIKELEPRNFPKNRAEFERELQDLAFEQIPKLAIHNVLESKIPHSLGLNKKETHNKTTEEIAKIAAVKVSTLKSALSIFDEDTWKADFTSSVASEKLKIESEWKRDWSLKCNGKELLIATYNKYGLRNYKLFVRRLIADNKSEGKKNWDSLMQKLAPVINRK